MAEPTTWTPKFEEKQIRDLIGQYHVNPGQFDDRDDDIEKLEEHAHYYRIPFARNKKHQDSYVLRMIKQASRGWAEGFSTVPMEKVDDFVGTNVGGAPKDTHEAIARNLGHLAGFIGYLPGGNKLRKLGALGVPLASKLGSGMMALKGKSVPMQAANFAQKKVGAVAKPYLDNLPDWARQGVVSDMGQGAFHLGVASGVSSVWHGVDEVFKSAGFGAGAGAVFRGVGNLNKFGEKLKPSQLKPNGSPDFSKMAEGQKVDLALRTMAGSAFQGLPSSLQQATTEEQVYAYAMGAFFGFKEMPFEVRTSREMIAESFKEHVNSPDPELNPRWDNLTPTMRNIVKRDFKEFFGGDDVRHAMYQMLKNQKGFDVKEILDLDKKYREGMEVDPVTGEIYSKSLSKKDLERYKDEYVKEQKFENPEDLDMHIQDVASIPGRIISKGGHVEQLFPNIGTVERIKRGDAIFKKWKSLLDSKSQKPKYNAETEIINFIQKTYGRSLEENEIGFWRNYAENLRKQEKIEQIEIADDEIGILNTNINSVGNRKNLVQERMVIEDAHSQEFDKYEKFYKYNKKYKSYEDFERAKKSKFFRVLDHIIYGNKEHDLTRAEFGIKKQEENRLRLANTKLPEGERLTKNQIRRQADYISSEYMKKTYQKLHSKMWKDGYYYIGGKGDANKMYFARLHPLIEARKTSHKRYLREAFKEFNKNDKNSKLVYENSYLRWRNRFPYMDNARERYDKAYVSNMLYELAFNGYDTGHRNFSANLNKVLNRAGYINNPKAFNKRQQIWFNSGISANSNFISAYLGANSDFKGNFRVGLFKESKKKDIGIKDLAEVYPEISDGAIIGRPEVIAALNADKGLPTDGNVNKSFIVSRHPQLGSLLGKYMIHGASPELDAYMRKRKIHFLMPESAAKQMGERHKMSKNLIFNQVTGRIKWEGNSKDIFELPPSDIRTVMSEITSSKYLKPQQLPKQMFSVLSAYGYKNTDPKVIKEMFETLVDRQIEGTERGVELVKEYKLSKSKENIEKLVENIEEIPINELFRIMRDPVNEELSHRLYEKILRINTEYVQNLAEEGEISRSELTEYRENVVDFENIIERLNRVFPDGSAGAYMHKFSRDYRMQAMRNYVVKKMTRPIMDNSVASRMRPYEIGFQSHPEMAKLNSKKGQEMFFLDDGFKDMWVKDPMFKNEQIKLGELWEKRDTYTGELKEKVNDILEAAVMRVPMDSQSGAHILKFSGFTGVKGYGSLLHPRTMKALGGADLDGDKAWVFFGGKNGMQKNWKEMYSSAKDEFVDFSNKNNPKEKHNKEAIDPENGQSYREQLAEVDPLEDAKMQHQTSQYSPFWRLKMSEGAASGREDLGMAVTRRMSIVGAYNALRGMEARGQSIDKISIQDNNGKWILGKDKKPKKYNVYIKKNEYDIPYYDFIAKDVKRAVFTTKNTDVDLQRFREMARTAVALGSDPMDESGIRGNLFESKILDTLFKVEVYNVNKRGNATYLNKGLTKKVNDIDKQESFYPQSIKKLGLHSKFGKVNSVLYGRNHRDNRRYTYSEIQNGVNSLANLPKSTQNTFLPLLAQRMKGIDWSDNIFRRITGGDEVVLNRIYYEHRDLVRESEWLKDAMGRQTLATEQGVFIQKVLNARLHHDGIQEISKTQEAFEKFINQTYRKGDKTKKVFRIPYELREYQPDNPDYRKAVLENILLKAEDFLVNDLSDMAALKSITDVVKKHNIPPERISLIHDEVDRIKTHDVFMAKKRKALEDIIASSDAEKEVDLLFGIKKAFGLEDKAGVVVDKIQIDSQIRKFKDTALRDNIGEQDLFDMLFLGTYSKGNRKQIEAVKKLRHIDHFKEQYEMLNKLLSNTSLIRAGVNSREIKDSNLRKFFGEYDKLLRVNELSEKQKKILLNELPPEDIKSFRDVDGNLLKNEFIDVNNLSTTDKIYLDSIRPFVGIQEGKIKDPELFKLRDSIKDHLSHYHNLDVENLNGLFRGLFKKDLNQATKYDLKTLDRYFQDMRDGTWFNQMMDWFTGRDPKNPPEIKRSNYWKFPKAVDRDLLRHPAMMEWVKDIGPYTDKLGNTLTNAKTIRPTSVIGEIQQISARTQELSMQTFEKEAEKFREKLRPYVSALAEGDSLFKIAVAKREWQYVLDVLRPNNKLKSHKLTQEEMNYRENLDAIKPLWESIRNKNFNVPTKDGNIKRTGEFIIKDIDRIITETNKKTHQWLRGDVAKVEKWLEISTNKNGEITWKGLDRLRTKFYKYVTDTIRYNKSIPIEDFGIDGLREIVKRVLVSQTPKVFRSNKNLRAQLEKIEIGKFDPTGNLGFEYYFPHMSFNRKKADNRLRSAMENIVNDPTLTKAEKERDMKKLAYQYKSLTGDYLAKDEMMDNFDIMQSTFEKMAKSKRKRLDHNILSQDLKKVGNQFNRNAHIGGWEITPEAYETYMRNSINTFYKQAMQVTVRSAMKNFNDSFREISKDSALTDRWMNFYKLYAQSAMGYPVSIPEKVMNNPKMKIKGTPYKWLADSTAKKRIDYIGKRLGVKRKELEKWNLDEATVDELSGIEYSKLQGWGALEAKWQLASLLAHPKSSIANLYGGTVHTWISAGYDNLKKARDFEYLRTNINPKWKSMKDVEKWMQELGIIEEFLVYEAGLNPTLKTKKNQAFMKDSLEKLKSNPELSDENLFSIAKKHGVTQRIFDKAASFMRVPERVLRRDAFMAHYIQAKNKFGGAIKDHNNPFLINFAKRGVKGTQFLYSAPYRPMWTNSTLGRVFSRFQLWSWNSVRFRNDVIRRAHIAGFQEGTSEFETFQRLAVADLFMLGMSNMFMYSLFENALPAPWNWFQDTADLLFGNEQERERAFYGSPIGPLQAITPPALRLLPPLFKGMLSDDYSQLTDYYLWTVPPFGRLARDVVGPGGMIDNPYYSITKFTGFPVMQVAKQIKEEKPEAIRGKFIY